MLEEIGFRLERQGKGSHAVYRRDDEEVVIAGAPGDELKKGYWEKLRKRFRLKG
jgi:predicted RNA binding protein YcfA (HicA-like mRNA interferase family)